MKNKRGLTSKLAGIAVILALAGTMTAYKVREEIAQARQDEQCAAVYATDAKVFEQRKTAAAGKLDLAVIGDSYAQGMYLDNPMDAFPYRLQAKTSGGPILVNGSGGSGYTAAGPCGDRQIDNRIEPILEHKPPVLIIEAGLNDRGHDEERVAVSAVLHRIALVSPKTQTVVLGPFAPASQRGEKLTAVRDAIKEAADKAKVTFIDPSGWDFELMPDGLHPTAKGHEQIAARLYAEIGPLLG